MLIKAVAISLIFVSILYVSHANAEEITVKEWDIPTPDSAPHDIVVGADGTVWFTEINANKIGRFDPITEQFTEYPIPTPSSSPHGLVVDENGNVWFTEVGAGQIGKLDPMTGGIEEYKTPTTNSGPHTPIFASDNILWFTEQRASKIGKFDINSGKMEEFPTLTPSANPYGIIVDDKNNPWFAELQGHHIGTVDATTGKVTEYAPLTDKSGPRRIAIDSNGVLWFTEYNAGKIASFDPKTEEMIEYDTSSKSSGPYAIWVDLYDNVWFSMTGIYKVGKFDQTAQKLTEYDLPSSQTHIKFIHTDDNGNVWFPNYNNNKIGVILISLVPSEENPSAHHIPYKGLCAPGFVPLGEICVLNDRCGPGIYPGKVCAMDGKIQPYLRPLQQGGAGIPAGNVICAEGLELIFKSHDGSPSCVKPSSISNLQERGWQTFQPTLVCTLEYNPVCGTDGKTYGNRCMLNAEHIVMKHQGECEIPTIDNFEKCAAAGNPVMESYPRQCRTPDGQTFVEEIN